MKSTTLIIARKELRTYFNAPIAYIFLAVFVIAGFYLFFDSFWSRNQAALRTLFSQLPMLFLILVPALTMRLWSEERKIGTLEHLLSLPVKLHQVVLGKFLASLALLAVALLLTTPLAVTAAVLGNLDAGPVLGGYLGALFMGAAYLAIGLFVSSLTENQVLSFILTLAICFLLWMVGEEFILARLPVSWLSAMESVGLGARFRSIGRGVLDLRDLVYYASFIAFFLYLNMGMLKLRKWR